MNKRLVTIILFLGFLAAPAVALADPITFLFTGNVTSVAGVLSGTFNTTQTLSGSYTFDSTLADQLPADPILGMYGPLTAMDVTIGSYPAKHSLGGAGVDDANDSVGADGVKADSYHFFGMMSGPSVADLPVQFFRADLQDNTARAFSSDALPLIPPNLSSFLGRNEWFLEFGDGVTVFAAVGGRITSLEPVPEPGTLLLLGSGLLGVAGYGRKKLFRKA